MTFPLSAESQRKPKIATGVFLLQVVRKVKHKIRRKIYKKPWRFKEIFQSHILYILIFLNYLNYYEKYTTNSQIKYELSPKNSALQILNNFFTQE